jgi:hypothetical protein
LRVQRRFDAAENLLVGELQAGHIGPVEILELNGLQLFQIIS